MWMLKTSDTEGAQLLNTPARTKVTSLSMFGSTDSIIVTISAELKAFLCSTTHKNKQRTKKGRSVLPCHVTFQSNAFLILKSMFLSFILGT